MCVACALTASVTRLKPAEPPPDMMPMAAAGSARHCHNSRAGKHDRAGVLLRACGRSENKHHQLRMQIAFKPYL